jgi:3-methylfumaryl-CoA hydratase
MGEYLDPTAVAGLAKLFDDELPAPAPGDVLPPLWHWVALPRWSPASATGADGHPVPGQAVAGAGLPRRMFAGGQVRFHVPLHVGEMVTRHETIGEVVMKHGQQGDLAIVPITTLIHDESGTLAIEERQDLIYRPAAHPQTGHVTPPSDIERAVIHEDGGIWEFRTDPTKLLRFSAATSNGHRIHYDHPYATQVEGYPGLVVHGPLMTLAVAEVVRLTSGPQPIDELRHRNLRPLFCGEPATIRKADPADDPGAVRWELATGSEVHVALDVQTTGADTPTTTRRTP